jgi:hypothetical protein
MWKILEFGALRSFRAARGDCTGTVSTRVCQRAGIEAVHKLQYDEYKLDNKVVFQNKPKKPNGDGCPTAEQAKLPWSIVKILNVIWWSVSKCMVLLYTYIQH